MGATGAEVARTRIKICGIKNGDDAAVAVAGGADALGFNFYPPSSRYVEPQLAAMIGQTIPAFITRVALFADADASAVRSVLAEGRYELLQFHGGESEEFCRSFGLPYIKVIHAVSTAAITRGVAEYESASGIMLETPAMDMPGGTGQTFDWDLIPTLSQPLILAGGLNPDNVCEAIERVQPFAVDVASGVEREKGVKDQDRIREFIHAVEAADRKKHAR